MTKNVLCVFKKGDQERSQQLGRQLHGTAPVVVFTKTSLLYGLRRIGVRIIDMNKT